MPWGYAAAALVGSQLLGGGGGGSSSQPTSTTVSSTELPSWAVDYGKDALARGAALTDINQNPYQAYGGQRVAGLGALQQQAIQNVGSPQAWGQNVQGYMSPYIQNVLDVQKRNAREDAAAQMGGLNAKASQMGAFGGSGIALQRAAQERGLQRQLGDIDATGMQNAWAQAQTQANTALGQQMQLGAIQQAKEQQGLDIGYQNFLDQKNYPYQQLSYFSNLLRGTPMGMNTTSQVYQAPPNAITQMAGMGLAGASIYNAANQPGVLNRAEGGEIKETRPAGLGELALYKMGA